jgi:hypothetical protein
VAECSVVGRELDTDAKSTATQEVTDYYLALDSLEGVESLEKLDFNFKCLIIIIVTPVCEDHA